MAGHVTDHLSRLGSPRSFAVIHRVVVDLRMLDSSDNSEFNAFFSTGNSGEESSFMVIIERTTQRITQFVGESGNTGHLESIGLHSQRIPRILWCLRSPTFTINNDRRINGIDCLADFIHCLDVVNAHQVEAETVYMIFFNPVEHGFDHILTHHGTVACRFVAASRTICQRTIGFLTIEISRNRTLKVASVSIVRVIVHHVEYYPNTGFVERLHHLFEFTDANSRIIRISRIRTIGHIVILRIISPIVFIFIQFGFIH